MPSFRKVGRAWSSDFPSSSYKISIFREEKQYGFGSAKLIVSSSINHASNNKSQENKTCNYFQSSLRSINMSMKVSYILKSTTHFSRQSHFHWKASRKVLVSCIISHNNRRENTSDPVTISGHRHQSRKLNTRPSIVDLKKFQPRERATDCGTNGCARDKPPLLCQAQGKD